MIYPFNGGASTHCITEDIGNFFIKRLEVLADARQHLKLLPFNKR